MDCSSLLSVSGNSEASQMRQLSEQFETIPCCEAERSTVTAEASITACKKVLCSNSLLESVEYWLRNEKKLCQVGFLEDEERTNYPTICFVNLDGVNANVKSKELQKKLDTVSPDLPYLIKSLNICQMKDHEFMLVSGLIAPGSCQDKADDSQKDESIKYLEDECLPPPVQWPGPPDVCLLQSARKCRKNDMACVVYEINKCMIGLDYFKGKKKHLVNTANWKTEEETNYSGSSIEEDFLTASEQFNDERDEASNDLKDPPRNNGFDPARGTKQSKAKSRVLLQMRQNKDNLFCHKTCNLQDTLVHKCADEESSGTVPLRCCEGNYVLEERGGERHKSERNAQEERLLLKSPHNNHLANSSLEEYHNACTIESVNMHLQTNIPVASVDIQDTENKISASPSLKENHCMDGDYASNLAESVLQDAFIRLSQSEPTFTTEAAVSICTESIDALSPSNTKVSLSNPPHPWNILPKIVIVQSPDNCENVSEWQEHCSPTLASRPLNETPGYVQEHIIDQNNSTSTGLPLSSVEVALVCAANVVGTISSPYITESLQMDGALYDITENFPYNGEKGDEALLCGSECGEINFSFSSALHGVTQVASAIGVAGLSDEPDMSFPAASSGLLSAAETSAAVTLQCSVSIGSCVDTFAHNIAEVLFKEAATILTKPDNYRSVGGFMKSVDQKIIETVTRPKVSHWEELSKDDFALNMSNLILKHSFEEANRVEKKHQEKENNSSVNTTKIFIESANKSLFSILYFTCRKIKDIVGHNDVAILFEDDGIINKDLKPTSNQDGISMNCNTTDSVEKCGHIPSDQGNRTDPSIFDEKSAGPELSQQVNLTSKCLHSRRGSDCANIAHNLTNQLRSRNSGAAITNVAIPQDQQKICEKDTNSSFSIDACEMDSRYGGAAQVHTCNYTSALTDIRAQSQPDKDQNILMISRQITLSPSKSSFHAEKLADTNLSINGFADQISKTVVSMATEMAAICLENTNAKQPWFCPWNTRLGDHEKFMVPQTSSSRAHTRSKESQISTAKRLKPPRLSEIKRKTQEQPELKEKLMNRVVDESLNFDDALDQINNFAHEVTAKIVNSAELTMIDSVKQGQGLARNRLQGDRWSRGKTSSYESIPEEDADSNNSWAALGAMTKFGQPTSRASSISKQSSCESITDEFSNFMMNQMENEGWGFELLLDDYASKHASNILNAALQQVCRKNGHLGVNATCLSKQSSTESITEEFYRYMLHELDKESKEMKANKDFHNMLIPPAGRTTMCFRQSSMPDRRASEGRLTVTPPVKANSLDGFAQNGRRNTLNVHLGDTALSTNLYKSLTDSCLYQKNKTDHITDMLISETWSNSIEALMRKNKIICDDADNQCSEQLSGSAQQCTEQCPTKVVADIFQRGKSIHSSQQSSIETAPHDSGIKSKICETDVHRAEKAKSVTNKKCFASHEWAAVKKKKMTHYPREVPLIHIEDDQQEEIKQCPQGKAACSTKRLMEKKLPEVDSEGQTESASLGLSYMKNLVAIEKATAEETPCSLSTSDDSMGSWSQLINEEDHAEDSSSYLHLSESNGNSSTSSSLGLVDLDAYQENPSVRILPSEIISEKETVKDNQECMDENASQLALCTINSHMDFLVLNFDLSPECADAELRAILQWIAASELGFPVIYFKKSQQKQIQKFLDVIHFTDQKAWKLKDLFLAIMQFCELQEGGKLPTSSLFDWLLEFG